ncbi:hypothetical protein DPMN_034578 [Dreissena polymorpha]|uniref:Uncharacterized protein n=1 Tax=Dreissena polymorpha TaxID=45954 RepID=A0A9D4RL41_DREPO|nr:hypothetical protein DPMN_034578 [Dreissena polymorpha]
MPDKPLKQFAHLRGTNILVKNVNARVFTNQMWTDGQLTKTNPKTSPEQSAIFQLVQEINKTNVLTKFHDDKPKNVTSIVTLPHPPGSHFHDDWAKIHVFQLTGTIFQLNSRIKETIVLTKFYEKKWAKNVTSRVFTCFHDIHIEKNAPPTGGHVFSPILTIFKLVRHINKTNVLFNFHDDWAKIVTSRVLTRKTAPPTGGHTYRQNFIGTNLLTKFHEYRTINVAPRVFTNKCGRTDNGQRPLSGKLPRPPGNNVFQQTGTIFKLNSQKNAPPTGGHVFSLIWTIFELVREIKKSNVFTNFHDDWAKIVTSRVFTSFELYRDFIRTKLLTKFHEDRTINVACRTDGRTDDGQRPVIKAHLSNQVS